MKFNFRNKKISSIVTVIPKNEVSFDDGAANFKNGASPKEGTLFADLTVASIEKLFAEGVLRKDDIGAMILCHAIARLFPAADRQRYLRAVESFARRLNFAPCRRNYSRFVRVRQIT